MLRAEISIFIRADPWKVSGVISDYLKWPEIFPLTIRQVKLLRHDRNVLTIEVDHKEGRVLNVLRIVSPAEIELKEWKKKYEARFLYHFGPNHGGTVFRIVAEIKPKKRFRPLRPFLKPVLKHRLKRYVAKPLKRYMEADRLNS